MQLYKRGKTYWVRFTMNGIQYRASTKEVTKTAAGERVKEILQQCEDNGGVKPSAVVPTLRGFAEGWFSDWIRESPRLSEGTREYYRYGLRLLNNQPIMEMRLNTIMDEDTDMINIPLSASTHNCALRTLRRMFNLARKRKIIRAVPTITLLRESGREKLVEPRDEAKIAAVIEGKGSRRGSLKTALYMILDAGARPKECVDMDVADINFERGLILVKNAKTKAGDRYLILTDRLKEKLTKHIGARTKGCLFPSPRRKGCAINRASLTAAWRIACNKAGVSSDLKLYCARHTFGTDAMDASKNAFLVMKALGHTELSTTERYQHHDIAQLAPLMDERNQRRAKLLVN